MTYTFVKEITSEMIDETLNSFFEEHDICDLSRQKILERVVSDAFDLDSWDEAEILVGALDEKQQEDLLCDIELRAIAYMRDDIHARLRE